MHFLIVVSLPISLSILADHSRAPPPDLHGAHHRLGGVCRRCKLFVMRCYVERSPSQKIEVKHVLKTTEIKHKALDQDNYGRVKRTGKQDLRYTVNDGGSPRATAPNHRSFDQAYSTRSPLSSPPASRSSSPLSSSRSRSPSPLSRSSSKWSQTPIRTAACNLLRNMSRRKCIEGFEATTPPISISRNASRRSSTPIIYSNSHELILKPPPIKQSLECTLEELCFGCIKKITITRDVVTADREIIKEEEVLIIKVKPGWGKGTNITFEGMGNETPGVDSGDVVFTIAQKPHQWYRRQGDDLECAVEIDLVDALSDCTLVIPLLSGEKMSLAIDDVIYPGYQKIIEGQGMPKPREQGKRGNLIITLLVKFPTELTEEQKSEISTILQDS